MKREDLSPEERLLKLIKGPRESNGTQEMQAPAQAPAKAFSNDKEPMPISLAPAKAKAEKKLDPFKIAVVSLLVVTVLSFLYLVYTIATRNQQADLVDIDKLIHYEVNKPMDAQGTKKPQAEVKEAEEPPAPAELRQLFGAPVTREAAPIEEEGPSIADLAKDLTLVGVITGENPQAIITDKKSRQTYYVSEGETVLDFKIQKVDKGQVILEYKQQTLKLSL